MYAAVVSEAMVINPNDANTIESPQTVTAKLAAQNDVEFVKCDCCGLTEECTPPSNPAVHLISAMRRILRRSMDSPRSMPTNPSKHGVLTRSDSCIPALPDHGKSYHTSVDEGGD